MLLPERPAQLKHAGHLGVWGLAGEGGALQRVGVREKQGWQGSRVRSERLGLTHLEMTAWSKGQKQDTGFNLSVR